MSDQTYTPENQPPVEIDPNAPIQPDPQAVQPPPVDPSMMAAGDPNMAAQPIEPPAFDPSQMPPAFAPPPGQPVDPATAQHMAPPPQYDPNMMAQPAQGAAPQYEQQYDPSNPAAMPSQGYDQPAMGADPNAGYYEQEQEFIPPEEDLSDVRPVPRVAIQAFCETNAVKGTIEYASQDRRMAKAHVDVEMGGIAAAVEYYQSATTPNLILVETNLVGPALIGELEKLAEVCDEGTNVVVIGHTNDVPLYRDLISRGVAEYLVAPVTMVEVMEIVSSLFVNPEASPLGNTIAFLGSKGGVGSSTVAHNVSWAISNTYKSDVILADLDLAFGTANIDFDQDPPTGVAEAVFSSDRIDETFLDRLLAKCTDHLSLLAAPSTLDREYDFEAEDFAQLLDVAQRGAPNIVVDLPHVWTGWMKHTLAAADKVVITATPDLACLRNTKNLVDMLNELRPNDEKPILVLNQCNVPKRPEISIEDFTQPLGIEPAIIVPFEPALFGLASNNGQMISEADPKSGVSESFETLAQILTGRRTIEKPKKMSIGSVFERFKRKKDAA